MLLEGIHGFMVRSVLASKLYLSDFHKLLHAISCVTVSQCLIVILFKIRISFVDVSVHRSLMMIHLIVLSWMEVR